MKGQAGPIGKKQGRSGRVFPKSAVNSKKPNTKHTVRDVERTLTYGNSYLERSRRCSDGDSDLALAAAFALVEGGRPELVF
jgi:hypothetical protein